MIEEVSAGGVVIFGNAVLLLKKFNGDFVEYLSNVLKQNSKDNIYHNESKSKWIKLKS